MSDEPAVVDTNILAYAYDHSDARRRKVCEKIVKSGFMGESRYYVSGQILGELYVVLTRKVSKPLSKAQAALIVNGFIDSPNWGKLDYNHITVKHAVEDLNTMGTSFWDMMIAETMRDADVKTLYTENERDFSMIPWIKVTNPIAGDSSAVPKEHRSPTSSSSGQRSKAASGSASP